jgi:hypothetical protein
LDLLASRLALSSITSIADIDVVSVIGPHCYIRDCLQALS